MTKTHIGNVTLPSSARMLIFILVTFFAMLFYLHQKVSLFVEAYKLNVNRKALSCLIDEKDYLAHNFSNELSFAKVHQWTENNDFIAAEKGRMFALNLEHKGPTVRKMSFAFLFNRLMKIPPNLPSAVAEETE